MKAHCRSKSCVYYATMRASSNCDGLPCLCCKRRFTDRYEYDMNGEYAVKRKMECSIDSAIINAISKGGYQCQE